MLTNVPAPFATTHLECTEPLSRDSKCQIIGSHSCSGCSAPVSILRKISTRFVVPDRDACSEEVRVLAPEGASQSERCGQYWPIPLVAPAQTFACFIFKGTVEVAIHGTNLTFRTYSSAATVGTGIGLFVAKQLVEGHGGQISIDSHVESDTRGTLIRVFLTAHTQYEMSQG